MKKIICILLCCCLLMPLIGCSSSSEEPSGPKTEKDYVLEAVHNRGRIEYIGSTIGGNELISSSFNVFRLNKKSDELYNATGTATFRDVYGNSYKKDFRCDVELLEDGTWKACNVEILD